MNQEIGMEIVKKLLFGLQRARSITREQLEALGSQRRLSAVAVNSILEDLNPWVHGPKGDGLLNALAKVVDRGKVSGMELYNFMTIINTLEPVTGRVVSALADYDFPEPSVSWIGELA